MRSWPYWPGRASGAVTLKKLECSKQAIALDTLAWDNIIGLRSHDPTISLAPIVAGPVPAAMESAKESVQEVVKIVAARFVRNPEDKK